MDFIINFYNNLDVVNKIIFWGVIIVVLLLLTFSIILIIKNKKLEKIIKCSGINIDEMNDNEIIAIKKESSEEEKKLTKNDELFLHEEKELLNNINENKKNESIPEEKQITIDNNKFVAEEYININRDELNNEKISKPYEKNIFKSTTTFQTSPISITKINTENSKEIENAKELHDNLNIQKNYESNHNSEGNNNSIDNQQHQFFENSTSLSPNTSYKKGNYLEELAKRNEVKTNDNYRTEYEKRQEEEAIIS